MGRFTGVAIRKDVENLNKNEIKFSRIIISCCFK